VGGGVSEDGFCLVCLVVAFFEDGVEVGDDQLAYCGEGFVWQCDGCPVVFDEWFGVRDAPGQALRQLKQDIDSSGARQKTEAITQQYFAQARATLAKLQHGFRRDELEQFVDHLQGRGY